MTIGKRKSYRQRLHFLHRMNTEEHRKVFIFLFCPCKSVVAIDSGGEGDNDTRDTGIDGC